MKVDCHIHTCFSPDGVDAPRAFIDKAVDDGFVHICITDHTDLMYAKPEYVGLTELKLYHETLQALKDEYKDKIYLGIGLECGWTRENEAAMTRLLKTADIEYVINSVHEMNGSDCYFPEHFIGRDRADTYNEYFDSLLQSLTAPYRFSAIGHISYVSRNAPYPDKRLRYTDFPDKIDTLLKALIDKGTIVELNTNVYGCGTQTLPDFDIIKRYKELGGRHLTFSSDAHRLIRLGDNYDAVAQKVKSLGFEYWTVIQNKEFAYIKI